MKRQEKIKELKRMSQGELAHFIQEKKAALMQLNFDLTAGKVKNIREIRETRRDIARAETFLKSKG